MLPFHRIPPRYLSPASYLLLAVLVAFGVGAHLTGDDIWPILAAAVLLVALLAYFLPAAAHAFNDRMFVGNAVSALLIVFLLAPLAVVGAAAAAARTAAENAISDLSDIFEGDAPLEEDVVEEPAGDAAEVTPPADVETSADDACYERFANEPEFSFDDLQNCLVEG